MRNRKRVRGDSDEDEEEEDSKHVEKSDWPTEDVKIRRSLRESKPSSISRGEEWHVEKKGKFSPTEVSPGRVGRRSNEGHSPIKQEASPLRTLRSEDPRDTSRHPSHKKRSPKDGHETTRKTRNEQKNIYVESEETDDTDVNKVDGHEEDSPFYPRGPQHVRFSPSAKVKEKGSPFGRKTRSSRRGLSSYIQSLPSEDEQSEFNRHYRNDLRRRQHRRASEEDKVEVGVKKRPRRGEARAEEEPNISTRKSSIRRSEEEDEEDSDGVGDPTVTESSLRRSTRSITVELAGGEEADTESGVEKQDDSDDLADADVEKGENAEEKEDSVTERRSSKRLKNSLLSSADEETPVTTRTRRSSRIAHDGTSDDDNEEEEEEDGEVEDPEQVELEDGELFEVHDGSRRSSRRNRNPVNRYQSGLDDSRSQRHSDEESDEEVDRSRITRAANKKKSPLKRRQYGLRENRRGVRRYTDEFPGQDDRPSRDQGLIRRGANVSRSGKSKRGGTDHKGRRRHRTGDSSSPSDSVSSDEEAFEMRKSKRMRIEMERMRPLNMNKNDVNKAIFRDRAKAGSSLADVQPMEMDMGVTFDNVGGLKDQINALKEMVMFPLLYPEMFKKFDIQPPRGVLFYGPPGTGKTLLARALASECSSENKKVAFFMRKGADCLSKWIGESERQLRMLFDQAYQMRPSIIFFDEIDGLAPVRSSRQDQIHSSIVSTLLALMDGLDNRGEIVIIGATNRIENIDPALRRPGRFDREFRFYLPDRKTRKEIIKLHTKTWEPPIPEALLNTLGTRTIGYCGADLKGLTAEAALNSLRRSYPQVYESSQKLAIDMDIVHVIKVDFEKALRKIVPSTHRVEDRVLGPLTKQIRPLLSHTLDQLTSHIKKTFPHSALGKGAVLPASLTHRPRLLIMAGEGQAGTTYLAPALLHFMEKLPVTKLDIPALFSNSARTPEEAVTSLIHLARRTQPGILYIPHLTTMWNVCSETVRATLITALTDCPPTAPMLVLAVSSTPYHDLDDNLQSLFSQNYKETFRVENPGENDRRDFYRPLVNACSQPPYKPPPPPPPKESLPVVPAPENRQLTEKEEKRLKRKESALLRELRIFLRDIWTKVNRENKFFMFRMPVNTDEVDDYLKYVRTPMDFETMHMKLDDGEYTCAQDFLDDIDLIAENAVDYNCDLKYETNRIICHRARALQDFAYALVKAEMDTDFEDECKEIHRRRVEATDKLVKFDKNVSKQVMGSPNKMQDIMAIVSTACKVCHSKDDEDAMLLCDGCDAGYHTYCSQPPIEEVPEGDWFCPSCPLENQDKDGCTPGSSERKKGSARSRRRKSRWSSGIVPKKKQVKKKLLESDDEKQQHDVTRALEKDILRDLDLTPSSPRASNSRAPPVPTTEVVSQEAAEGRQEDPSVPTGVRIDQAKIVQWSNDLVRLTDNFPVEKLERIYTNMAKVEALSCNTFNFVIQVIRRFRTMTDRTDLPTELQAELENVRSQERQERHFQTLPRR